MDDDFQPCMKCPGRDSGLPVLQVDVSFMLILKPLTMESDPPIQKHPLLASERLASRHCIYFAAA